MFGENGLKKNKTFSANTQKVWWSWVQGYFFVFTWSPRSFESFRAIVATKSPRFPRDAVAFILVEPNCFQAYFIAGKKVQLCKKLRKKVFPLCSINCYTLTINRNKGESFYTMSSIVSQHIVWKLLKMSHMNFGIFTIFCPIKTDLSGNTLWPQASGLQKLAKIDHFWHF